jgi:hypothetical protein
MSELLYLGSVLLTLTAYVVGVWALWQIVEGVYWIYCKATGKTY